MGESTLKVYKNGSEWVIATDPADAAKMWSETTGERIEDYGHEWKEETAPLSVLDEDTGIRAEMTPDEWCARNGRGYLCSTEH